MFVCVPHIFNSAVCWYQQQHIRNTCVLWLLQLANNHSQKQKRKQLLFYFGSLFKQYSYHFFFLFCPLQLLKLIGFIVGCWLFGACFFLLILANKLSSLVIVLGCQVNRKSEGGEREREEEIKKKSPLTQIDNNKTYHGINTSKDFDFVYLM